ncbi:AraC family transcriptional regulator [Chitinibacter sp. GC72]|uniref:AraC family transcriptional regulator n=1 Tax=Chitinibacter sp. GC72 TaxID=1526917 RepID=UPI0012FA705C|nr:AraC family transcriptional regulator [Chitinibacter sp. GC72]
MLIREWITNSHCQPWHYQQYVVPKIQFHLHYHPEFELTYTRNASGLRYISGKAEAFPRFDLVLVAPNQPHSWEAAPNPDGSPQTLQVLFFRESWLRQLAESGLPELRGVCNWLGNIRHAIQFSATLAEQLAPLFERLHESRGLERISLILELLAILYKAPDAASINSGREITLPDQRVEQALAYLSQHFARPVYLSEVAKVALTSEANLKRLFNQQLGKSFSEILAELRVIHACNLLLSSSMKIENIASQSGFPSLSNFHRIFQAYTQLTPHAFRRLRAPSRSELGAQASLT